MDTLHRVVLGSLVACIVFSAAALASADTSRSGIVVRFDDLDLDTHAGVTTLYARLESAARTACTAEGGQLAGAEVTACIDYRIRQAVSRIGAPRLVVLYETRSGHALLRLRP